MSLPFNALLIALLCIQPSVLMGYCVSRGSRGRGRAAAPQWAWQEGSTTTRPLSQTRASAEWAGPLPVPPWS